MKVFRVKYFALLNRQEGLRDLSTFSNRVCLDLIKLVELYDNCNGRDLKHWITMTNTFINNILNSEKKISENYNRPQISFIRAIEDQYTVTKILGNDFLKYCSLGFNETYISNLCNEILKMTDKNEKKYTEAIKINGGFLVSSEDYILLFKYIALCLSGQLDYRNIDFWSDINTIVRMKVDYTKNIFWGNLDIRKIIANSVFQFKGNIPDRENNINNYI